MTDVTNMTDEDVRVLRGVPSRWAASQRPMSRVLLEKAADEIDRLRSKVERLKTAYANLAPVAIELREKRDALRAALRSIQDCQGYEFCSHCRTVTWNALQQHEGEEPGR